MNKKKTFFNIFNLLTLIGSRPHLLVVVVVGFLVDVVMVDFVVVGRTTLFDACANGKTVVVVEVDSSWNKTKDIVQTFFNFRGGGF